MNEQHLKYRKGEEGEGAGGGQLVVEPHLT